MPYKDKEKQKEWYRKRYADNAKALRDLIEATPCTDCGQFFRWWVMEWDHVPERGKKKENLGTLYRKNLGSPAFIVEMKKCDLVCANCHKTRTHLRDTTRV